MGRKTNRPAKARSSASKPVTITKSAAKKKHQQWSKDRSERVRDALNRDTDLLYNVLENPNVPTPSSILRTDSIVSLAESMQSLGRCANDPS